MRCLSIIALALTIVLPSFAQEGEAHSNWVTDYDSAVKLAKEQKKDILVDFTGSDWCGWCIKLDEEVFEHEAFLKPAMEKYVLCALDFPRGEEAKAKVPNPERNAELQKKYAIQGFPTILVLSVDGTLLGRTGYQPGGPEAYVGHLDEISSKGRKALVAVRELEAEYAAAADDAAKLAVASKAADTLAEMTAEAPGASKIADIARKALELDPKNEKGMRVKALRAILKAGLADEAVLEIARNDDPKNADGLYEHAVAAQCRSVGSEEDLKAATAAFDALHALGIKDKALAVELYVNNAFWQHRFIEDADKAKLYAGKAKELCSEEEAGRYKQLFEMILGDG